MPVPWRDSPSDARPCTPQPAPPTPRARRWGQQRPIICRQRLLNRMGCWLENGVEGGSSGKPAPRSGPAPQGEGPTNHPTVQVRKLGSSLTPPPSLPAKTCRFRFLNNSPTHTQTTISIQLIMQLVSLPVHLVAAITPTFSHSVIQQNASHVLP